VRHGEAVAHAAEVIAGQAPIWSAAVYPDQAFIAALLHDLGLLALARHHAREDALVASVASEKRLARWRVERDVLGIDHAQIGARLAAHWSFPEAVTTVIAFHHDFASAPTEARWLAAVIALGDALCNEDEMAGMGEGAYVGTIEESIALLGLAPDALGQIVDQTRCDAARDLAVLEAIGGY